MTGSTKILTVSYGTFSCTLEGFDDPLGSMREMAEYFRDLAADDRYFGAEPPTPDVEMLQKIAEKEVRRRVEARVSDSGVALVAAAAAEAEAEEAGAAEPKPAAEPQKTEAAPPIADDETGIVGPLTYDDEFMSDEPEDALTPDPHARPDGSGPAESVAEKLRRIRAVVSKTIELEDRSAAQREQSPNADNPDKRDRALTETIQQIQADLAGDESEDGTAADTIEPEAEKAPETVASAAPKPEPEPEPEPDDEDAVTDDTSWAKALTDRAGTVSETPEAPADERPRTEQPATRILAPEPEADVGRLLDETDTKLNEDDTVRRRRVISQMRAAVAATKADRLVSRQVTREEAEEAEQNPYREDLSEVVVEDDTPDEPARTAARTPSAPPLVLVSSQRIDAAEPEAADWPEAELPQDLAEFAADVGARELPELMEAAAAYTVFTEGQSSFTRPEIMKRVARMDPALKLSREESLRSFGQLLRQGTFHKLERGQFTIDKSTRYNPAQRSATQ